MDPDPINPTMALLAGFLFATSLMGWVVAHLQAIKATKAQERAIYLKSICEQQQANLVQMGQAIANLQEQLNGEDDGEGWKHGRN